MFLQTAAYDKFSYMQISRHERAINGTSVPRLMIIRNSKQHKRNALCEEQYNCDTPGIDILDFRINLSPIQTYINDIFFVELVYLNNILFALDEDKDLRKSKYFTK